MQRRPPSPTLPATLFPYTPLFRSVDRDLDFGADLEVGLLPRRGEFAQRHAAFALQPDVDDGEIVLDSRDGALDDMAFEAVGAAERLLEHGREIIAGGVCRSGHKNVVPELTFSGRPVGSGGLVAEHAAHAEYGSGSQTTGRTRRNRR